MNLMNDPWIPVIREDGTREQIAPWQIAEAENPVMDIAAPRPDFRGALYQFLIGLLQATCTPSDPDDWESYFDVWPSTEALKTAFANLESAFELFQDRGAAFMQEYPSLEGGKVEPISMLFIGEPGENTKSKNLDLFIQSGSKASLCASCCASVLYTLGLNGPPGGQGHMTGLIGNGPVTTLLKEDGNPLWKNLWLNILTEDDFEFRSIATPDSSVFSWVGETKTSESCKTKKCPNGCEKCSTFPDSKNSLYVFWGTPWRLRLVEPESNGVCSICGNWSEHIFTKVRRRPNGSRYMGEWIYPLSPRKKILKSTSIEMMRGNHVGNSYKDWLGLNFKDDSSEVRSSISIHSFYHEKQKWRNFSPYLWCFYYDMEPGQAKARCWYEHTLPVVFVDESYREQYLQFIETLIDAAKECVKELRIQVKGAWFSDFNDAKGDISMIDSSFWEATESAFYKHLHSLSETSRFLPASVARQWYSLVIKSCLDLFDHWVLEGNAEDLDMKRITQARRFLISKLPRIKKMKDLKQMADSETEVA